MNSPGCDIVWIEVFCREDGIGYEKPVLITYAKKAKPVVIAVPKASVSDHWTPRAETFPARAMKSPMMINLSLGVTKEMRSFSCR